MRKRNLPYFAIGIIMVLALILTTIFAGPTCFAWAAPGQDPAIADPIRLTIVHTNDTHARVKEGDGIGFAKIAALIKELQQENPNTLVLDAGDTFHGQTIAILNHGDSIAQIMNEIGYQAMAPGNHDFNYGYERLAELDGKTDFPILAANIIKPDGSNLFTPYMIKEIAGVRIGILGLATSETATSTHPDNVEGLTFTDPSVAAQKIVALLKDQADVVIAVTHLGVDKTSIFTSARLAHEVPGIDLIVDGHSHTMMEQGQMEGKTMIVSTGEYGQNLGVVDLYLSGGKVIDIKAHLITKDETAGIRPDEAMVQTIRAIGDQQSVLLDQVIGKTLVDLEGDRDSVRTGETNLGNLIADAMVEATGADCALINGGTIRASIGAGDITRGKIVEVLPFSNYIVTKPVTGANIKLALEHGTGAWPESLGGFPQVAGLKFTVDTSQPPGNRVGGIMINGQPLDIHREYILATNDFIASGGDNYTMLANDTVFNRYGAVDEALAAYIQARGVVNPATEGRFNVHLNPEAIDTPVDYYIVMPGDYLVKIAKKFNTTWQALQKSNNFPNPNLIYPGQKIILP